MRPVQQLYYEQSQMHCPTHGNSFIRFMMEKGPQGRVCWCCGAVLPDGSFCMRSAKWHTIEEIRDPDLERLAAASVSPLTAKAVPCCR